MTLLRILLIFATLAFAATAQDGAPTRIEQLQSRLNLTPEQSEKIRPILQEEAAKLREIRAKYEGSTARRDRLRMLRDLRDVQQSAEKRINPILTKDQQKEWKKIKDERREELRDRLEEKRGR